MRNWTIAAAAVLFVATTASAQDYRRGPRDRDRREQTVAIQKREVQERLDKVNAMLSEAIGKSQGDRQLTRLLKAMRVELDGVRDHIAGAPVVSPAPSAPVPVPAPQLTPPNVPPPGWNTSPSYPPQPPPPPPDARVYPISDSNLKGLISAVDGESFGNDRLRVLGQAAPANWFLVAQVRQLLTRFDFPNDRLEAARLLKPRILDRENFFQLYASFDFAADKATLKEILER